MDKWIVLADGDTKLTGQLIEIDERLRADGITTFYADVRAAQANGELAELERRFAEDREGRRG